MDYALYIATVVGAIALLLMMPRKGYNPIVFGAILGAGALGGLWIYLSKSLPDELGVSKAAMIYYYIFSALSIGFAVRVITHKKPVYAALWFVMAVLSTAGLLLILGAEFMAMAMAIIYGGAILVTYVFVIMLAAESVRDDPDEDKSAGANTGKSEASPQYESVSREPVGAIVAGFLLLAVIGSVLFQPETLSEMVPNKASAMTDAQARELLTNRRADVVMERVRQEVGDDTKISLPAEGDGVSNTEMVGLDLFQSHPLGLELAGVILLISLIGAVVIARKRVDMEPTDADGSAGT